MNHAVLNQKEFIIIVYNVPLNKSSGIHNSSQIVFSLDRIVFSKTFMVEFQIWSSFEDLFSYLY